MQLIDEKTIRHGLHLAELIDVMRAALLAQARGECETPMPMHLDIAPVTAQVHIKSSYRQGGRFFAVKMAGTFPANVQRGLSTGNGLMLLVSAQTGQPEAMLADGGYLTDVRTAAVAALVARELGRHDDTLGILGTGIQARLQAQLHAEVLNLRRIVLWGRNLERVSACLRDLGALLPGVSVETADSPAAVARSARLIVCCTASRAPLLQARDLEIGSHISAVGADSPGKQELHPSVLENASLVLVDSLQQCLRLGELQHTPGIAGRVVEIGAFLITPSQYSTSAWTVCDFTGLGVEDLFIAEHCYDQTSRSHVR